MSPAVIIIIVTLIVLVLLSVVLGMLRRYATKRVQAARERFPTAKLIIPSANFYGQESKGVAQMRGNGTMVLTNTELYFEQWLTNREFRIPLSAIQAIETPSAYLGKTNFRPILKVVFRDESGQTDAMGWIVPDVEAAKQAINDAREA
jgi:hypothetical protein